MTHGLFKRTEFSSRSCRPRPGGSQYAAYWIRNGPRAVQCPARVRRRGPCNAPTIKFSVGRGHSSFVSFPEPAENLARQGVAGSLFRVQRGTGSGRASGAPTGGRHAFTAAAFTSCNLPISPCVGQRTLSSGPGTESRATATTTRFPHFGHIK